MGSAMLLRDRGLSINKVALNKNKNSTSVV
jgi:hypothetical protein